MLKTASAGSGSGFKYRFSEGDILKEIEVYIKETYSQHYDRNGIQLLDLFMVDPKLAVPFCQTNIMKYTYRLGQKDGFNLKDVRKIQHYAILLEHALSQMEKP